MEYLAGIVTLALIYAMVSLAENVSVGWAGQFGVAQASMFGLGAYVYALGMQEGHAMLLVVVGVLVVGALAGALIALLTKDLTGDFFTIMTLALVVVIQSLAQNLGVTGGFGGLFGIPQLSVFGFTPEDYGDWLVLLLPLTALYAVVYVGLASTRLGVLFKAVREDERATASLGRSVLAIKVIAMAAASCGTAFAGAVYAGYIGFIDPITLGLIFSLFILSGLLIGGLGNPIGVVVGATLVTALPEALRLVPSLPEDTRARLLQVIYSLLLLAFMIFRPQGLIPERPGKWSIGRWTWRRRLERPRAITPLRVEPLVEVGHAVSSDGPEETSERNLPSR